MPAAGELRRRRNLTSGPRLLRRADAVTAGVRIASILIEA
jgi:hypothetical protein